MTYKAINCMRLKGYLVWLTGLHFFKQGSIVTKIHAGETMAETLDPITWKQAPLSSEEASFQVHGHKLAKLKSLAATDEASEFWTGFTA